MMRLFMVLAMALAVGWGCNLKVGARPSVGKRGINKKSGAGRTVSGNQHGKLTTEKTGVADSSDDATDESATESPPAEAGQPTDDDAGK